MPENGRKPRHRLTNKILSTLIFTLPFVLAIIYETRTNEGEATLFFRYARDITWHVKEGESPQISFPREGPFDVSRGYARLPAFRDRLKKDGYVIRSAARQSDKLLALSRYGIPVPYDKNNTVGLRLNDKKGVEAYRVNLNIQQFPSFQSIPPILVKVLLHRENRELFDFHRPFLNPAIEWDRFTLAFIRYLGGEVFGISGGMGGSTLATQIEKFRHSPGGMTTGPLEKVRQMIGASLWSYQENPNTIAIRKEIVKEYLNGMPLGAAPGHGEINGIGNGMWAWFGKTIDELIDDLKLDETKPAMLVRKARTVKQVLCLIIATQHPALYLQKDHDALEKMAIRHLNLLAADGIISAPLKEAALKLSLRFQQGAPIPPPISLVERKGTNAIRTRLLDSLGIKTLYELDRLDLVVDTSLDFETQQKVNVSLNSLYDGDFLKEHGFIAPYLLEKGDPNRIVYSFTLFESLPGVNLLRIQTDTLNRPLSISTGIKLELGSTAKLRTLASYLMTIDQIDDVLSSKGGIGQESAPQDPLSEWVSEYRLFHPDVTREELLKASLQRSISASPYQAFFTGGGLHTFKNFKEEQDSQFFTIEEGFRQSINLVFIRLMKEVVDYYIAQLGYNLETLLSDTKAPQRIVLLKEAAATEATEFLRKYYRLHSSGRYEESFRLLCQSYQHPLRNWVLLFLKDYPDTTFAQLTQAAREHFHDPDINQLSLQKLYKAYRGKSYKLTDEAYLLGKHPLEVWMVFYLKDHPKTLWNKVLEDSKEAREISSAWLFKTRFYNAQNIRIRTLVEKKAFAEIHRNWKALGYPFGALVPSLATAIGSSADRPVSLADLVGIILSDGMCKPLIRIKELHFGENTPYETHYVNTSSSGKRVMSPEVAGVLQYALRQVVEKGTAQRINNTYLNPNGEPFAIGGKTGTGDNRFETFRRGGELVSSKILSRTSTFVFFLDKFFGIVTAHVEGPEASQYEFTSALAVQVLKILQPAIEPLLRAEAPRTFRSDLQTTGE